jgi:hypothetical protein
MAGAKNRKGGVGRMPDKRPERKSAKSEPERKRRRETREKG